MPLNTLANEISKLFQKFSTLSPRSTASEKSTGLELYITKNLVWNCRGHITVNSKLNERLAFTVRFKTQERK